jgi:hypothetical protein
MSKNSLCAPLAVLPDITAVAPLSAQDASCIAEIVEVLKKHDRLTRFGVTLLHQHFNVADDEVLMETCDPESRTLTIQPAPKSELYSLDFIETSWRLDSGTPVMHCVCRRDPDTGDHNHYHVKRQEAPIQG